MDPIAIFVSDDDYLRSDECLGAEIVGRGSETVLRVKLGPGGREKLNHLADLNRQAAEMDDYVALLLFIHGKPVSRLAMVFEPLPAFEMDYSGLSQGEAETLLSIISAGKTSPQCPGRGSS
ncbi:hypothetical protein GRF61_14085 [Azoarcus sp. TTM-91]|uniref:hypothetical protein n=1 Tax=Azoarcus sp. TTM-91 TaxID=2691581 RepID=UPI00145F5C76|nr:hypothetical protein [Azoarcus sp. TTM-91]NMG35574.1 hypothetical protein [Azoarcus sp. TTM-91]